jgi:hypothetical protein
MGWTSHSERRVPSRFLLATRSGSPIRRILLLGFGAIFALWLISAYALRQRVIEADSHVAAITTEFTDGEDVLSAVREQVLLSSVVVRDAALDNRPDSVSSQREQLRAIREEVERRLQGYLPRVDSEVEREHWTRLRAELDEYWASLSPVVTGQLTGQAQRHSEARARTSGITGPAHAQPGCPP